MQNDISVLEKTNLSFEELVLELGTIQTEKLLSKAAFNCTYQNTGKP